MASSTSSKPKYHVAFSFAGEEGNTLKKSPRS